MKTTADLKALLEGINAEVAEQRAAEEAARAAEVQEKVVVVMQLLPLVVASPRAAAAVRDQMYSVPQVKAAVREHLRGELLKRSDDRRSDNLLPHATAQIAVAVGEFGELSAEKFAEVRAKNEAVYTHQKTAHEGRWQHGCPGCTLLFVQESKAEGVLHRYITLTHWSGALMKERYDLNRPKLVPRGQVGPIGNALLVPLKGAPDPEGGEGGDKKLPSRKERRAQMRTAPTNTEDGEKSSGKIEKKRGGAKNSTREASELVEQQ